MILERLKQDEVVEDYIMEEVGTVETAGNGKAKSRSSQAKANNTGDKGSPKTRSAGGGGLRIPRGVGGQSSLWNPSTVWVHGIPIIQRTNQTVLTSVQCDAFGLL